MLAGNWKTARVVAHYSAGATAEHPHRLPRAVAERRRAPRPRPARDRRLGPRRGHCLSRWGHDFRPDYRYVARFIGERAPDAPVLCLTATAKPAVREDIRSHFHDRLGIDLRVFDGGTQRTNLAFAVTPTTGGEKFAHIHQWLLKELPPEMPGGAIVYCATRRHTEDVAVFLRANDLLRPTTSTPGCRRRPARRCSSASSRASCG